MPKQVLFITYMSNTIQLKERLIHLVVIIMRYFNRLTSRNPFQIKSTKLRALLTGFVLITNKNSVSCNEAGDGAEIQVSLGSQSVFMCTIWKKKCLKPLSSLLDKKSFCIRKWAYVFA